MGVEELRAVLEAQAQAKAEARLRHAHQEASRLRRETEAREARLLADELAQHERELRREAGAIVEEARRRARQRVLAARQGVLDGIFQQAEQALADAACSPDYRRALPRQLARTLAYVGPDAVVECPAALGEAVRGALPEGRSERVETSPQAEPGFRVRAADGSVEVDATLRARLERSRPRLAIELVRRLGIEPCAST